VAAVSPHVISTVRRFLKKKFRRGIFEIKAKTLRVSPMLREVKRRAEDDDTPNKSMDARRNSSPFKTCVSNPELREFGFARVISAVGRFLFRKLKNEIAFLKTKTLRVKINLCEDKRRAKDNDTPNKSLDVRRNSLPHKNVVR
jgi:hypothetical protein